VGLVGTDHHPFHRLVDWLDEVAATRRDVRVVVQYGASRAPRVAEGHAFLTHAELDELVAASDAVVCHGGPGTITDAREAGHVPLCVPRDPVLGEHVDGHQQRFATTVGRAGIVHHVTGHDHLLRLLDAVLSGAMPRTAGPVVTPLRDVARSRLAAELDEVLAAPRRGLFHRAS
jgi:UDP-N-acetylglucosamine transferase subunit ALG13